MIRYSNGKGPRAVQVTYKYRAPIITRATRPIDWDRFALGVLFVQMSAMTLFVVLSAILN
jgi:hypothetical protein